MERNVRPPGERFELPGRQKPVLILNDPELVEDMVVTRHLHTGVSPSLTHNRVKVGDSGGGDVRAPVI
jgi:hypothetical protein